MVRGDGGPRRIDFSIPQDPTVCLIRSQPQLCTFHSELHPEVAEVLARLCLVASQIVDVPLVSSAWRLNVCQHKPNALDRLSLPDKAP